MSASQTPLTGRKVLFITLAAFGVIIAVNVTMMVSAIRTFPGLEVENSYVASQVFDAEMAAQKALGWTTTVKATDREVRVTITDKAGKPVFPSQITLRVGRLTHARQDQMLTLSYADGAFVAPANLDRGAWEARLKATASNGTRLHQRFTFVIGEGS